MYTFNGHLYENDRSRTQLGFTHEMAKKSGYNETRYNFRGGGEAIVQTALQENTELREHVATIVLREMQISFHIFHGTPWRCNSTVPFVTFNPKYAKYAMEEKLKIVHESIMASLKKGDPDNLLGYQRKAITRLPEVSIGEYGDMKVSVIALEAENAWGLVIPSVAQACFVREHFHAYDSTSFAKGFDLKKITTYWLLFPADSPQAKLNVSLGGEPMRDERDYFAVPYKSKGAEWLPELLIWENIENNRYTFNGHTYVDKGPYTFVGKSDKFTRPINKSFTHRMVPPNTRDNTLTDNIFVRGSGEMHTIQTASQEEVATVMFREIQVNSNFFVREICNHHFKYVVCSVPFVTFSSKYANQEDRLKLVEGPIMEILKKADPENLLGYQQAAIQALGTAAFSAPATTLPVEN
jgi:hypothetical protein